MPKSKFDADSAGLHLNILDVKIRRLQGKMAMHDKRAGMKNYDKESEELQAKKLAKDIEGWELRRDIYENLVLKETELNQI
jgi:hypothetical protein